MRTIAIRAAITVAAVYGYFLIFAQFALVEMLRGVGVSVGGEKLALALMAASGIAGGFWVALRGADSGLVRCALGVAAMVAVIAPWAGNLAVGLLVAVATGASLGVATVGISALLPGWCGVVWVGVGTGIGYALCNSPPVFTASPSIQAWIAANFACVGLFVMPVDREWLVKDREEDPFHRWAVVGMFTALVWLDSAAFFIIQHTGDLRDATWGSGMLWRNAAVHLMAAVVAGLALRKWNAGKLLLAAWVVLAVAAAAVNGTAGRGLAGLFYPAGVSIYSTALVAWPGWFSGVGDKRAAAWRAAWLFGIAGWIGSANGIGMAETLHRVPPVFIVASGAAVMMVLWIHGRGGWKVPALVSLMTVITIAFPKRATVGNSADPDPTRGRAVYLAEGCIHCHSQYPRPGTVDEEIWGDESGSGEGLHGRPVLIGNRRQGPDLRNIGARRSAAWLRIHFNKPRALVPDSTMPSYHHLFDDSRGADLIAYLQSAGIDQIGTRMERAATWVPAAKNGGADGASLFSRHCAACHGVDGKGDGNIGRLLGKPPANLVDGPFVWTTGASENARLKVARTIKFGIPGTDMPGHEVFSDAQINALVAGVMRLRSHGGADAP